MVLCHIWHGMVWWRRKRVGGFSYRSIQLDCACYANEDSEILIENGTTENSVFSISISISTFCTELEPKWIMNYFKHFWFLLISLCPLSSVHFIFFCHFSVLQSINVSIRKSWEPCRLHSSPTKNFLFFFEFSFYFQFSSNLLLLRRKNSSSHMPCVCGAVCACVHHMEPHYWYTCDRYSIIFKLVWMFIWRTYQIGLAGYRIHNIVCGWSYSYWCGIEDIFFENYAIFVKKNQRKTKKKISDFHR